MNALKTSARNTHARGYSYIFSQPPCRLQHAQHRPLSAAVRRGARRVGGSNRRDDYLSDDKFDVNLEEEVIRGGDRKRRRLTKDVLEREQAEDEGLDDDIVSLEKSINSMRIPEQIPESIKKMIFSDDELQRMEESGSIGDEDIYPYRIMPQHPVPMQAQLHLNKLNEALDDANVENAQDAKHQQNIWRWYSRSKTNVPRLLQMIPNEAWNLLWKSQASDAPENVDRASRLATLAQDKKAAGWDLSQEEQFAHIEGLFMDGEQRQALQLFEETLVDENARSSRLMEMGVRMYAHHGNPERAHVLLDRLFELDSGADPRILTAVISAHASRRNEASVLTAWSLYQDLQRRLSTDMQIPEYDTVTLAFLDSGQKDFALAVFRDMMLRGESERKPTSVFSRLGQFVSMAGSPKETNNLSLDAIRYLPRRFQNKWFYASWLRKLISEGQVNAAAQVVELMYERNVKPDAKHMNGIVAAWLRDQRTHFQHRAEELGWTMIQRRLDMVNERHHSLTARDAAPGDLSTARFEQAPSTTPHTTTHDNPTDETNQRALTSVNANTRLALPVSVSRPVPAATIETFCVLLQYYLRRGLHTHIAHLRSLLEPAELQMNSYFMNHLIHAALRTRGHRAAWDTFASLSETVKPDLESWQCLWQCAKNHVHDVRNVVMTGFPMPRELMRRTFDWYSALSDKDKAKTRTEVREENTLMLDVVRAFCLAHDLEGTFVALHTLHSMFGLTPSEPVVHTLLNMLTKLLPPNLAAGSKQYYPRRYRRSKKHGVDAERNMIAATYLLDSVRKERLVELAGEGVEFEDLSEEMRQQENQGICLQMLVKVMQERRLGPDEDRQKQFHYGAIQRAADECGVGEVNVGTALKISA